jgi:multiple sugar transport system ATP-binding protein
VDLGVRPEHIQLGETGLPATVSVVQPIGPFTYVTVRSDSASLTARVPGIARLSPGDLTRVSLDPGGLMFFDRATGRRLDSRSSSPSTG